jgi:hypothetical protein
MNWKQKSKKKVENVFMVPEICDSQNYTAFFPVVGDGGEFSVM